MKARVFLPFPEWDNKCLQLSGEGKTVTEIHKELNRTRDWVNKWLKRAQSGEKEWYLDQSKEPRLRPSILSVAQLPYI
ncbi:MAG: helix-turn-helix domain-containing protein [Candidatus Scalindua sp. AMX11]|nr:MAG: helix-turn-helix domain-containing protein [Candidatus Scalindua sp.]NOG82945.1 helix-turn-helix domain-containing protein [Planctomycetota bacterium]RZV68766.1 MAG: helix-turn-helix domain-containing protein [Candidatus Scalindua sp. SCAELEC01]TDE63842.1 MAG: helix-turn-helix domain-containing protein [Candidatus Scalindua sp. AMX11]